VGFLRTLMAGKDILLLDEPFGAQLDHALGCPRQ
jgi:ABC-type nitrate/sulfonate/bicarbonate transport system ATPase subunit